MKIILTDPCDSGRHLALLPSACGCHDAHQPLPRVVPICSLSRSPSWYLQWPHLCPGLLCYRALLAYSLQVAGLFMVIFIFWTPCFYLTEYGLVHGMSAGLASYLFAIINVGSFVGRMLGGTFAYHACQFNVVIFACYSSDIFLFCWLAITSSAGLILLSVLLEGTSDIIKAMMMSTITLCTSSKPGMFEILNLVFFVLANGTFPTSHRLEYVPASQRSSLASQVLLELQSWAP